METRFGLLRKETNAKKRFRRTAIESSAMLLVAMASTLGVTMGSKKDSAWQVSTIRISRRKLEDEQVCVCEREGELLQSKKEHKSHRPRRCMSSMAAAS